MPHLAAHLLQGRQPCLARLGLSLLRRVRLLRLKLGVRVGLGLRLRLGLGLRVRVGVRIRVRGSCGACASSL